MKKAHAALFILMTGILFLHLTTGAEAMGQHLSTITSGAKSIEGTYTLILYGGNFADDLETVAILGREGSGYIFEPYGQDFRYKVYKGVPAQEAVNRAVEFVSANPSFMRVVISEIKGGKNDTAGYEVLPLYQPFVYGIPNVLDVDYRLSGNKITVYIKLKPYVERKLHDGQSSRDHGR